MIEQYKTPISALDKIGIRRIIHKLFDHLDELFIDEEATQKYIGENPGDQILICYAKNPYPEKEMRYAVTRYLDFYKDRNVITNYTVKKIESTPDIMDVNVLIDFGKHEMDFAHTRMFD